MCQNQRDLLVEIQEINGDDLTEFNDENVPKGGKQMCLVVTCKNCDYVDLTPFKI